MAVPTISVPVNSIVKARVFTSCQQQLGVNVLYYRLVAIESAPDGDLQELCAAFSAWVASAYKAVMTQEADFRGCGLQNLGDGLVGTWPSIEVYSDSGKGVGTVTGTALPKQTCGIITKRTVIAKRLGRGRMYVPFPGEADNLDHGIPSTSYVDRLTTLASKVLANFSISTAGEGLNTLQPLLRGDLTPANTTDGTWMWNPIVDYTPRPRWATQRRRGDYGRQNEFPV